MNNYDKYTEKEFSDSKQSVYKLLEVYGDEYVSKTAKFSSEMTEVLIKELSDKNYNLIIEGTLRTSEVPLNTAKLLKD